MTYTKIEEIRKLQDNWNGYGAKKFENELIDKSIAFLDELGDLASKVSVFPTACDSIQVEIENIHIYCEVGIFKDHFELFYETKFNNDEGDEAFTDLQKVVEKFKILNSPPECDFSPTTSLCEIEY